MPDYIRIAIHWIVIDISMRHMSQITADDNFNFEPVNKPRYVYP